MGEREDMLLALGSGPLAPPPPAPGSLDYALEQIKRESPTGEAGPRPPAPGSLEEAQAMASALGVHDGVRGWDDPRVPQFGGSIPRKTNLMYGQDTVPALPRDKRFGPSNAPAPAPTLQPMVTPQEEIRPAPTLASMGAPGIAPGIGGAGGGGFGGLERNLRDAHGRQLQGYSDAQNLELEKGIDEGLKAQGMSDAYAANAARMQRDAEDQQRIDALANQKHDAFMARQETLANDLAKQQVDPGRLLRNADAADQMIIGLGAALGGVFGNGHNDYLDRLDKLVDRDINAQLVDIDSKKASFGARQSLFGQMLAETGDRRLAAMQTRKLIYDAMDQKVKSDSERLGIPILKDNAAIIGQQFAQKRADLDAQIQAESLRQAKAAAAAAVAAQRAAEERLYQHQKDLAEFGLKSRALDIEETKAGTAKAGANKEQQTAQNELNAGLTELAEARKNVKSITAGTAAGTAAAKALPAWAPGVTGARGNMNARNDYNIRAKMLVGAAYKLGTDSQEPKRMELIDEYSKPYVILSDDNEEIAQQKIDALQHLMVTKARAKEAAPAAPRFTPDQTGPAAINPWTGKAVK